MPKKEPKKKTYPPVRAPKSAKTFPVSKKKFWPETRVAKKINIKVGDNPMKVPSGTRAADVLEMLGGAGAGAQLVMKVAENLGSAILVNMLVRIRTAAGVSMEQMAAKLNCKTKTVLDIEMGLDDALTIRTIKEYAKLSKLQLAVSIKPRDTSAVLLT